jgi:phage gp36-like protein
MLSADLRQLGLEYLMLVRSVARANMGLAVRLFRARRPESLQRICRMSLQQIEALVEHGGVPFGVDDEDALYASLLDLQAAKPFEGIPSDLVEHCAAIQMAYLERLRAVGRNNPTLACSIFRLQHDSTRTLRALAALDFAGLRVLSRLHHFLAVNSTVGYELLITMACNEMSVERMQIAGIAAMAATGREGDHSLCHVRVEAGT